MPQLPSAKGLHLLKTANARIRGNPAAHAREKIIALAAAGERRKQEKSDKIYSPKTIPKLRHHFVS